MSMQRLFVTGAGGMVGSYVPEVFHDLDLVMTGLGEELVSLDVRDPEAVARAIRAAHPDLVLHLAAATDVDRCQQEPDWAYHVNAIGTQNVALACQAQDVPLVYVSTAAVFAGDKPEPYLEFDPPNPLSVYGRSKLSGESVVTSLLSRWYIVRSSWMIGGGLKDKKFVGKLARQLMEGRGPLRAVNDKWGNPTYAKDLLHGIRRLVETEFFGLYHMANQGVASRYDIALAIRDVLQRPEIVIEPVSSAAFPLLAPRGRSEALRNAKLELLGLHTMRPWQEALDEYVRSELTPLLSHVARAG